MKDLSTNKKPLHFVKLDALRFLAAFMVVFVHAFDAWSGNFGIPKKLANAELTGWSWFGGYVNNFVHNFNFGVDLFFLISGFLITYLLIREKSEKGKINIPAFFMRRILRIWPLYFLIIGLCYFLIVPWMIPGYISHHFPLPNVDYKSTLLFYNNFHTIQTQTWEFPFAHFWSICIEEHFYLVWPFLVAFTPIKKLPIVLVTIIFSSMIFRVWSFHYYPNNWFMIDMHTLARIDALALGGLVAWRHFHHPFSLRMPFGLRMILLAVLLWGLIIYDLSAWTNVFAVCFKRLAFMLLAGLLMMNFVFNPEAKFHWGPNHIFNYLGRCCFGIYLWGNILLQVILMKIFRADHNPVSDWMITHLGPGKAYWILVLGISIIVPVISYELIEKPFMKLKGKFAVVKTRT